MKHIAEQFPLPHMPTSQSIRLIDSYPIMRGVGDTIRLGICPLCGRNVTRSRANRRGGKCRYDGSQFNAAGYLVWHRLKPSDSALNFAGRTSTTTERNQ